MSTVPRERITVEAYLALERSSPDRHEYIDGELFAMGGASHEHNRIVSNLIFELRGVLGEGPCYPLSNDMRVRAGQARCVYPDVVVVCGQPELEDSDILINPSLIIEVLSQTTEAYDRGAKFAFYRELASLKEYLLVSQREQRIEQFVRQPDGRWLLSEAIAGDLPLPTVNAALSIAGAYHGIDFERA
ncbi:MAG TPA: Uma2 family endonuclease [Kofleriaceae bacterium]|nr:Uma2 family endonuclease [Kofleriaceae bacterium]